MRSATTLGHARRDLFEAALIDRRSIWQLYRWVAVTLVKPVMIFVAIGQFIVAGTRFFLALIVMTDADHKTLTLAPMQYSRMNMGNPGACSQSSS
jgi:ABC-type glycerol-3-phosphate transport system permease component